MPDLTVAENVFLGAQPTDAAASSTGARMTREAREQLPSLGIDIDPARRMGSPADRPAAADRAARVLFSGARIIILDEPTSALSPPEVAAPVRRAAPAASEQGRSIVFISHFLDDVLAISDTRHGLPQRPQGRHRADGRRIDKGWVIAAHDRPRPRGARGQLYRRDRARQPARRAGRARGRGPRATARLSATSRSTCGPARSLGVYGFMGCGQIELARALFGKLQARSAARMRIDGKPVRLRATPPRRARAGIAFVPESRRIDAVPHTSRSTRTSRSPSSAASSALLAEARPRARDRRRPHRAICSIRPPRADIALGTPVGRQPAEGRAGQMADLPAQGADPVASRRAAWMSAPRRTWCASCKALRDQGIGVVVLSTEPETVLSLADRIIGA